MKTRRSNARIVATHFRLLHQLPLACIHVIVVDRARRDERFVVIPQRSGAELRIGAVKML